MYLTDSCKALPTYSWDINGTAPVQQTSTRNHPEAPGEDSKDSPRSPFTELHSKSSLACIAELPGVTAANELDAPEITSKSAFGDEAGKESHKSVDETRGGSRKSIEKR